MSLTNILQARLDLIAFLVLCVGATTGVQLWLRRSYRTRLPRLSWVALLAVVAGGTAFSESSGDRERLRLRQMLEGIAPTYATELQRLGHEKINPNTPADDPTYLALIDAQKRWLQCNPEVNDIYTFGRRADGTVIILVDSETDYDHDGKYIGERERRTPTGEVYSEVDDSLRHAFAGEVTFDGVPASDRWRTWVSAFVPMRDSAGNVYAVLGVDYDARSWNGAILRARAATLGFAGILIVTLIGCASTFTILRAELLRRSQTEVALRESEALLREQATHDKLTGLANRRLFHDRLSEALARVTRHPEHKFAVLFLDFDRFKVVNDSLGHEVGDILLQGIASRVAQSLRPNDSISRSASPDTAARVGGDEFLILLDGIRTGTDAEIVAARIQRAISVPFLIKGHEVQSTVSIGITTSDGKYTRAEDIIRDADTAMYHAKAQGKARHVMFSPRMHAQAVERLTAENDLRRAIDRRELVLEYQPIVSLDSGRVIGFEALVRWDHPTRGRVVPAEFIPLAEECGLIVPLGRMVLDDACRQLAAWRAKFPEQKMLTMSVNVSRRQLESDGLFEQVRDAIQLHGILPNQLKLEITESVLMQDADTAVEFLQQFRALGVQLHIDDFGTGYSSLSSLHRFPIDGLKIDRAFIANASERRDYAAVVNAIVTLARNLNMALVAEGVETAEQVALLQSLGCVQAQGYYFAKPLTVSDAERFMLDRGVATAAA